MIISFSGTDGSGKTTTATALMNYLKKAGLKVEYRIEFDYFLLKYLLKLVPQKTLHQKREKFLNASKKRAGLISRIWVYMVAFDQLLEWFYLNIKVTVRPHIIITDRCAFDFLLSFQYLKCLSPFSQFIFRKFPTFTVPLLLEVDPEIALKRKEETHSYPLEYYQSQRDHYLREAKGKKIPILNTNQSPEDTLRDVLKIIQEKLQKKDSLQLHQIALEKLDKQEVLMPGTQEQIAPNDLVPQAARIYGKGSVYNHAESDLAERFKNTLILVKQKLDSAGIKFIAIKTLPRHYDVCPTDLDILVHKEVFEKTNLILEGVTEAKDVPKVHKAITHKAHGLMPIDNHMEISWLAHRVVDVKKLWKRKEQIFYKKIPVNVPSVEDEILIVTAHSIYQHHYTTLGEFLFLWTLMSHQKNLDLAYLNDHAKDFGWEKKLWNILNAVNQKACFLGLKTLELGIYTQKSNNYSPRELLKPVFNHHFSVIPKANNEQWKDFFITFYRRARYRLNRTLPYNENWLKKYL